MKILSIHPCIVIDSIVRRVPIHAQERRLRVGKARDEEEEDKEEEEEKKEGKILLLEKRKERWKRSGPGRNKGNNRIREEDRGGKTKGTREGSVGGRRSSTFARVGGRERKRRAAGRPTDGVGQ